jgi:hypothetical protein
VEESRRASENALWAKVRPIAPPGVQSQGRAPLASLGCLNFAL